MTPGDIVLERPLAEAPAAGHTLTRRRVYIFLTRQGFLFAATLLVMLLGAVNYTNSMAYLLTFLLGGVFLVCMLHTYRNLRGLVIRLEKPDPAYAGGRLSFPILLDNRSGYARTALRIRVRNDTASGDWMQLDLLPDVLRRVLLDLPAAKRGWYRIDPLQLESRYPLGLFRAWCYLDSDIDYLVYPRPDGNTRLPDAVSVNTDELAGRRAGTDDFIGFRAYRAGDPIRSIDWKAVAREQGLLVKRFTGAGGRRLILCWNETPGIDEEARLSQLCLWVQEAERAGLQYGLELPGARVEFGHGEFHLHQCLQYLAKHGFTEPRA